MNIRDKLDCIIDIQELKRQEADPAGNQSQSEEEEEPQVFLNARMTQDHYETENVMQYDQKFMDKVRVWALGGNGG